MLGLLAGAGLKMKMKRCSVAKHVVILPRLEECLEKEKVFDFGDRRCLAVRMHDRCGDDLESHRYLAFLSFERLAKIPGDQLTWAEEALPPCACDLVGSSSQSAVMFALIVRLSRLEALTRPSSNR